jgi:hypothetical protein
MTDIKQNLRELLEEIKKDPSKVEKMSEDQVRKLRKEINPYSHIVGLTGRHVVLTYTNMESEFQKYLMVVAMTGFMYKMLDEFDQKDHPQMDGTEMPAGWREYTKKFLGTMFEFNPEDHVRPIKDLNAKDPNIRKKSDIKNSDIGRAKLKELNIPMPPTDTCHRFQRYLNAHFEQLRDLVAILTGFEPITEDAIQVLGTFDNEDKSKEFREKHRDDFTSPVIDVKEGAWAFTGPWQTNADKQDFYNQNTEFLRAVSDRLEQDSKTGKELMGKRVTKQKKRDIEENGPDPKSLANYKSAMGNKMEALNVVQPELTEDEFTKAKAIHAQTKKKKQNLKDQSKATSSEDPVKASSAATRLDTSKNTEFNKNVNPESDSESESDSLPDDAVEVNIISIEDGGKTVGTSKFYTEADKPKEIEKQAKEINELRPYPFVGYEPAKKVGGRRVAQTRKRGELLKQREKVLARNNDDDDEDVDDKVPSTSASVEMEALKSAGTATYDVDDSGVKKLGKKK